jgi:hypothetical protein
LHEIGEEPSQARVRRQPAIGERHGHPRSLARDPELAADRPRSSCVEHVRVDVRLVSASGKEPGLDGPLASHSLETAAALREPDVAQAASEEAALSRGLGDDAERPEALIDNVGVDAFAVVRANKLVAPAVQCREPQGAEGGLPRAQELGIHVTDPEVDPASLGPGGGDRRVGVRHQLRDDLGEIDPGLGEVLPEVTSADPTVAQLRDVDRHG